MEERGLGQNKVLSQYLPGETEKHCKKPTRVVSRSRFETGASRIGVQTLTASDSFLGFIATGLLCQENIMAFNH
jgi:hypothetical protein